MIDILLKTLRRNIKIKLNYVVGWQSRSFFLTGVLQYLANSMALLVQKNCGERKSCQNPFMAILRQKKFRWTTKLEGGGVGLRP